MRPKFIVMKPFFTTFLFLLACCTAKEPNSAHANWKTIEIGNYIFEFPPSFKLVPEQGIDSYVGKVLGDSMGFGFDFGYYTGPLPQTQQEYLADGDWKFSLSEKFMKAGVTYGISNMPKVAVLNIRPATVKDSAVGGGCDYVARCRHDTTEFYYPVYMPAEIKKLTFKIDTVDNQYRKIVYTKNPSRNGAAIYVRDLGGFNKSMNSSLALSLGAGNLTPHQTEIALEIFATVKYKKEKNGK